MKNIDSFIQERLVINSKSKSIDYTFSTDDIDELRDEITRRIKDNPDADLNDIDVSKITNMSFLFDDLDKIDDNRDIRNIKIDQWDVSNVEDMSCMFYKCPNFNCDLSKWNVSNVKDMLGMFYECSNFNSDLSNWDVSNVKDMSNMFWMCDEFNCDLSDWDISNVIRMDNMFRGCKSLKKIPSWYNE